ncbi:sensor histidine kinase [Primorskyibacter sp. S187A]|uniref:sensor histidine kinase n=1 Tax=Primorskyibacter sp. S187A TaxID=3415130 RepID=UPI003C7BFEAB
MRPYPVPSNETARHLTTTEMDLARFRNDGFLTHVTGLVKSILNVPVAFVAQITQDNQDFLAIEGIDLEGTPRTHSICSFTIARKKTTVFPDTLRDERSARHPSVADFGLRFSVSAPVILSNGFCVGSVCGIDFVPHDTPHADTIAQIETLAAMVARFYETATVQDAEHISRMEKIAEDAKAEFLALIGHELRTPLNGIHGMAQILDDRDDETREIRDAIVQSSEHLHRIVENNLAFTELSTGEIVLEESQLDLGRTLKSSLALFQKLAALRGKKIKLHSLPDDVLMQGDAVKMDLALSCLVDNCIAHGGAQTEVTLRKMEDGSAELVIFDNGPGIASDKADDIWEAFTVGQEIRTRDADGIGLGLPLTRRIIELHGGEIDLKSDEEGLLVVLKIPHYRIESAEVSAA